jgi:hypothetical protein
MAILARGLDRGNGETLDVRENLGAISLRPSKKRRPNRIRIFHCALQAEASGKFVNYSCHIGYFDVWFLNGKNQIEGLSSV